VVVQQQLNLQPLLLLKLQLKLTKHRLSEPILELGIDAFSKDGLVKDIPVVGILAKGYNVVQKIKLIAYVKKVGKFFNELKDIPVAEREKFITQIDKNYKRLFDAIHIQIARLNDEEKARLIGKLFKAAIREEIKIDDFKRYSNMIESVFLPDFVLLEATSFGLIGRSIKESLYKQGFLDQKRNDAEVQMFAHGSMAKAKRPEYEINDFGKQIIKICFPESENSWPL
jgi:hypothetical protein